MLERSHKPLQATVAMREKLHVHRLLVAGSDFETVEFCRRKIRPNPEWAVGALAIKSPTQQFQGPPGLIPDSKTEIEPIRNARAARQA